jgi:CHASE3 domain sensor protein
MSWTPVQKLSIGAGAALFVLALLGAVAFNAVRVQSTQGVLVDRTNAAVDAVNVVLTATDAAERSSRRFLNGADSVDRRAFETSRRHLEDALDLLRERSENDPRERLAVDSITQIVAARLAMLDGAMTRRVRFGADSVARFMADDDTREMPTMVPLLQEVRDAVLRELAEQTRAQVDQGRIASQAMLGASLMAFLLAAMAFSPVSSDIAARLSRRLGVSTGVVLVPEVATATHEKGRTTSERLTRLQQMILLLETPGRAEETGEVVLERGLLALHPSTALVAVLDQERWRVIAQRDAQFPVDSVLDATTAAPLRDAALRGEPVVIETAGERDQRYPLATFFGAAKEVAFLAAPMIADGVVRGAVAITYPKNHTFSDEDRAFVATVGRLGGAALARSALSV